jgi:hypothetical protein
MRRILLCAVADAEAADDLDGGGSLKVTGHWIPRIKMLSFVWQ